MKSLTFLLPTTLFRLAAAVALAIAALALPACGGGSDGASTGPTEPTTPDSTAKAEMRCAP